MGFEKTWVVLDGFFVVITWLISAFSWLLTALISELKNTPLFSTLFLAGPFLRDSAIWDAIGDANRDRRLQFMTLDRPNAIIHAKAIRLSLFLGQ